MALPGAAIDARAQSPGPPAKSASSSESLLPEVSVWSESREHLAQQVLNCLRDNDVKGLLALTVSEQEYKTIVWPELPVSNPRNNLPFEWVYGRHTQMSRTSLAFKLPAFEKRSLKFVRMLERPEKDQYKNIRIIPTPFVYVENAEGKEEEIRLFGSILEYKGKFKVFSYKTD